MSAPHLSMPAGLTGASARREIVGFHVGDPMHALNITVMDPPGPGGANHHYVVEHGEFAQMLHVRFQKGPIAENGVNGVTNEALLAIVADRLRAFQRGPFDGFDNLAALEHTEAAIERLNKRTLERLERLERGVEGTMQA